ncbi:alpha-L-rhamnosidase C-terminal domain-containing protein [Streptomyces sp. NPDC048291]|uniref:alpha-L-rhamnosidase C-terminal domain-containing protein n=1 Tax=Streptomyces sp. NPDC048291 TaxID=3365530 RepID=UPI003710E798
MSSEWHRRADGRTELAVTIPYNTEAEIWVPAQGRPVSARPGAVPVCDDTSGGADHQVYRARAGSYRFR